MKALAAATVAAALLGGLLAPHDPAATVGAAWAPPSGAAWLGTDALGRDVLSRVLAGGASLTGLALLAALCAVALGIAWGLAAGWTGRGGAVVADVLLAVPFLLPALVFAIALPGWGAVVAGVVVAGAPLTMRLVRDLAGQARTSGYVEAALGRGERTGAILAREVLPSLARFAAADAAMRFVMALQLASALAVLGFGPQPPAADWGLMLRENLPGATLNPAGLLAPAVALTLLSVAVAVAGQPKATRHRRRAAVAAPEPRPGLDVAELTVLDATGRVLVEDFALRVGPGRVVALVGESGAGKTTAVLGALDALGHGAVRVSGAVAWDGRPVRTGRSARRWRRAHVGYVDQDPTGALDPRRPLRHSLGPDGMRALAELGLGEYGDRLPGALSGGQARRAVLARALGTAPPLLVLDEPTAGLDPAAAERVRQTIAARRGSTLVITHDDALIAAVADDVVRIGVARIGVARIGVEEPAAPAASRTPAVGDDVLRVSGLRTVRGVVTDAAFCVRAGEMVALLGESGAGKSTLLRTIAGLAPLEAGSVELDGSALPARVRDRSSADLRAVQFVAQDSALNPAHSAAQAVARPLRLLGGVSRAVARTRAVEQLGLVGLPSDTATRRPARLSGGQRQRVALARALAAGPRLLLADEPTAALDPATAAGVLDLLDGLRAAGLAVLVATHDPAVAARADRCVRVAAGTTTESRTEPTRVH